MLNDISKTPSHALNERVYAYVHNNIVNGIIVGIFRFDDGDYIYRIDVGGTDNIFSVFEDSILHEYAEEREETKEEKDTS